MYQIKELQNHWWSGIFFRVQHQSWNLFSTCSCVYKKISCRGTSSKLNSKNHQSAVCVSIQCPFDAGYCARQRTYHQSKPLAKHTNQCPGNSFSAIIPLIMPLIAAPTFKRSHNSMHKVGSTTEIFVPSWSNPISAESLFQQIRLQNCRLASRFLPEVLRFSHVLTITGSREFWRSLKTEETQGLSVFAVCHQFERHSSTRNRSEIQSLTLEARTLAELSETGTSTQKVVRGSLHSLCHTAYGYGKKQFL